jgi:O-antigen/teichoic acid export membrane protein
MSQISELWRTWRNDRLLGKVLRNTGYLFSSNTVSMVVSSITGLLVPLLLSPAEYGVLGMVILYASTINRLLSFRMGELVIRYAGQHLATGNSQKAAAVIKAAGLAEGLTSITAYGLLVLTAPLAASIIIKDTSISGLIVFYGVALLANGVSETSLALLQIGNHYRTQAVLNLLQSGVTAVLIVAAFWMKAGMPFLIGAYLGGKLAYGLGAMAAAAWRSNQVLGSGWWKTSLGLLDNRREMTRFALSTNVSGTLNMVIRDSEVLWVGFFLSAVQAGYYKFALAIMNMIVLPVSPLIITTFPEISKAVAQREWPQLGELLKRTSLLAFGYTAAVVAAFVLGGRFLLGVYSGGDYLPALPVILVLLAGYGFANVFFWNRPLLLSFGKENEPLVITAVVGAAKTALMFVLVRPFGYLAQAALLSGYFIFSIGVMVLRGLKELRRRQAGLDPEGTA